ncbi:hypothetical protein BGX27_004781, partial [Mortierella sp. AM989]
IMGVRGAFEFVLKHYTPEVVLPRDLGSKVHVDMNAIFLGYIMSTLKSLTLKNWKKPSHRREPPNDLVKRVGALVAGKLEPHFSKESTMLHFDGAYTKEKEIAHIERLEAFKLQLDHATEKILDAQNMISSLKTPGIPTSSERRKVVQMLGDAAGVNEIFKDQNQYVIVGIDPGIKSTATCCVVSSDNAIPPVNITILQGSHAYPTIKYLQGLEGAKRKAGIDIFESRIEAIGSPKTEIGQQESSWKRLQQSIVRHVHSVLLVQKPLRDFYSTTMFKIKRFHLKQALSAVVNTGIDKTIVAAGCKGKPSEGSVRPLFVVGD